LSCRVENSTQQSVVSTQFVRVAMSKVWMPDPITRGRQKVWASFQDRVTHSEATFAASGGVEGDSDQGLTVVDLVGGDQRERLGEGSANDLDMFVLFRVRCTFAKVAGEVDLHGLTEEAGTGKVFRKPVSSIISRFAAARGASRGSMRPAGSSSRN